MKTSIFVLSLLCTLPVFATVTAGVPDCPTQFEGTVKTIVKELGPERALAIQKVIFDNKHNLKGEAPASVDVDVLQNGPFKLEKGVDYRVQLRNGKLCWIERL